MSISLQQSRTAMPQVIQTQDQQVNTYFQNNANKIVVYKKNNLVELQREFGICPGTIIHRFIRYFSQGNKARLKLTRDDIWKMVNRIRSIRTISSALSKLQKLGLIERESIIKRRKDGCIKGESYYSFNFNKFNDLCGFTGEQLLPCKYTTSLSFLQKEKRSVDQKINTLGESDLSHEGEISPAKKSVRLPNNKVLEFKLTKRMRQKALDAKLAAENVEIEYEACQRYYKNKGSTFTAKAFTARIWPLWIQRTLQGWGESRRKKQLAEASMAKRIPAKQIELTIDPTIREEDRVRITANLATLSTSQTVFVVEKCQEGDTNEYESNLLYKVYIPASSRSVLTKEDKRAIYLSHLKAIFLLDNNPLFVKIAA